MEHCINCKGTPQEREATRACVHCGAKYCGSCFDELSLQEDGTDNGGCVECNKPVNEAI